jgi:hypothetical protein
VRCLGIKRDWSPLLRAPLLRALSFFGPGEVRALHVGDVKGLELIVSALDGAKTSVTSLCVERYTSTNETDRASAIVERFADSLTHLELPLMWRCESSDRALGRCTKLESLPYARLYDPAVWINLSQLHTLRGVDLNVVPVSVIAAALPKLHTLDAVVGFGAESPSALTGFFEVLVPRLRVLSLISFASAWSEEDYASSKGPPPPALPVLQYLSWQANDAPVELARRFMGARPLELSTSAAVIADWLTAERTTASREARYTPLSRVRELVVRGGTLGPSEVAQVLRAAPQLRRLVVHSVRVGADGDPFWFSDTSGRTRPALSGMTQAGLRMVEVGCDVDSDSYESDEEDMKFLPPVDCALRLRRSHFPRLQCLIFKDRHCKEHRYDAMLQD